MCARSHAYACGACSDARGHMGTGSAAACAHGARHTRRFDSNGDGRVSYIELYKVLSRERTAVGAAARRPLWEEDEVVRAAVDSLCAELYGRREYVYELLERMDTNKTGYLSREEMKRGLDKLGLRLGATELSHVMRGCAHTARTRCCMRACGG